jgi:hypothetical protein
MGCKFFSVILLSHHKAVIGDISKVIPMAAVSNLTVSEKSIQLNVPEKCTLWIYSESKPVVVRINSKPAESITFNNNILSVTVYKNNARLEIEY